MDEMALSKTAKNFPVIMMQTVNRASGKWLHSGNRLAVLAK